MKTNFKFYDLHPSNLLNNRQTNAHTAAHRIHPDVKRISFAHFVMLLLAITVIFASISNTEAVELVSSISTTPVKIDPALVEPVKIDPVRVPIVTEPIKTETEVSEPVKVDPVIVTEVIEPVKVNPVIVTEVTEPIKVNPVIVTEVNEPVKVEPVIVTEVTEPVKIDPVRVPVVEPIKLEPVLAVPVIRQPITTDITPAVINPSLIPIDINKDVSLPKTFNPDIASVIVEKNFSPYLTLNPDIVKNAIPVSYADEAQIFEFEKADQEGWFVFYADGKQVIDIDVTSKLDLQYDVINQEGTSVKLNQYGGLDPGIVAGFYYIRVINIGGLGPDNSFGVETTVLFSQGGIVHGLVSNACDEQPIGGASVSIETDFRFTHSDGSYEFVPKNPTQHTMIALAEGYQSTQAVSQVQDILQAKADFKLTPIEGCATESEQVTQQAPESKITGNRQPAVYNDITQVLDLPDVHASNLPGGEKHFRAQLSVIEGSAPWLFAVTLLEEITTENQNVSANYDYATASLTIPAVQAFGKLYSVEFTHTPDFKFSIVSYSELE